MVSTRPINNANLVDSYLENRLGLGCQFKYSLTFFQLEREYELRPTLDSSVKKVVRKKSQETNSEILSA